MKDDLTFQKDYGELSSKWDVIKIYTVKTNTDLQWLDGNSNLIPLNLVWERQEEITLSMEEIRNKFKIPDHCVLKIKSN